MAGYSNRSPSPLSTRPINPNPKIAEVNSGLRRSFTGYSRPSVHTNPRNFYPSTPANSPSDFARRRSVGKEGIIAKDCDQKENDEKDHNLKPAKIRQAGSGSKSFMSPTISAASKFAPSPRKKVLVERNDSVRTSISLSDGKAVFFSADFEDTEPKSDMDSNLHKISESSLYSEVSDKADRKAVLECPPDSKPLKKVTFLEVPSSSNPENTFDSMSDSVTIDSECFNENKTFCSSESPVMAPLDADPSMPPYDPKTNYLSPRPQFLHYKPNPRIEILLNKGKGIDSDEFNELDNSFITEIMSRISSDSDGTEESSQKEESEVSSSMEMVLGLDENEEDMVLGVNDKEEDTHVSDSLPFSATVPDVISEENFEAKTDKKPSWVFPRLNWVSLLLIFLILCVSVSVTDLPVISTSRLKDLSLTNLYHESKAAVFTNANLDGFVRHVIPYSVNSMSYISKLITVFGREDKLGTSHFMNLTDLQKEIMIDDHFMNKQFNNGFDENEMEEDVDTESQEFEDEVSAEVDSDKIIDQEIEAVSYLDTEPREFEDEVSAEIDSEEIIDKEVEEVSPSSPAQHAEFMPQNQENLNEGEILLATTDSLNLEIQSEANTVKPEVIAAENIVGGNDPGSSAQPDLTLLDNETSSKIDSLVKGFEGKFAVVGVSCLVVASIAAAFIHRNRRTSTSSNAVPSTDPLLSKMSISGLAVDAEPSSQNWAADDVIGDSSCPSEMSSFEKNSLAHSIRGGVSNEAQSHDRKERKYLKRESLASSTEYSGSPSYGSFTTYERIPIKHVNGDDEIITPVRRSSRLRNQVTSP